jgi:hypothetical protein
MSLSRGSDRKSVWHVAGGPKICSAALPVENPFSPGRAAEQFIEPSRIFAGQGGGTVHQPQCIIQAASVP